MITNENEKTKYKEMDKIYIPQTKNNQAYTYKINGDFITIITNNNCYTNYNTTYCECNYYNYKENLMSDTYTCSTNNNNPTISYNNITSDINYSSHIREIYIQDKSILLLIIIVGIIFASFLTKERSSY